MKKYTFSSLYRGQQIIKMVCAKNAKDAAQKLNINTYTINKYCFINKIDTPFDGIVAYFDSGYLWSKEKSLIRVVMPLERLQAIIDSYKDKEYSTFKNMIGIE